ncbi:MAG: thiamine phosphate synthase [Candidatus Sumerlaeaceae bacterium]|nr:thiamine phosphate synthase [Candidatus Sumerlaeaceae bacterium]
MPDYLINTVSAFSFRPCEWGIYVITDTALAKRSHLEIAREVIEGGGKVIQLRDKSLPREELLPIAREIRQLTTEHGVTFIINDDPWLALEVDADGVHVGQEDMSVAEVRKIVGPEKIVGLSTHTLQQALVAASLPVDYIGVGPIFPTRTKENPWPAVGIDLLREVRKKVSLRITAIGGINEKDIPELVRAGAHNIAFIGEVMRAHSICEKVRRLCAAFAAARQQMEEERENETER